MQLKSVIIFDKFSRGVHSNQSNEVTEKEEDSDQHLAHPHSDLYTRNLSLINIQNFKFLINNDICNVTPLAIVTIVHSAAENTKAREIIRFVVKLNISLRTNSLSRTTWGSAKISEAVLKLVFLLGEEGILFLFELNNL